MRGISPVAFGFSLLLSSAKAGNESLTDTYNKYRDTYCFSNVTQVTENGTTVFRVSDGLANEEFDVAMQPDCLFPIGSNSKLFTSVALYQLEEAGRVNLSDPVNNWLKQDDFVQFGYPNQTKWCPRLANSTDDSPCEEITFVQLLHMSSGIGDSVNCDNVDSEHCYRSAEDLAYYKGSIGVYVGRFINDPLVFKPGTNYSYANPNFVLLSYLVEKISGQSFGGYLKEHIFDKLDLKDTIYDPYAGALSVNHRVTDEYLSYFIQGEGGQKPRLVLTGTCSPLIKSGALSGTGGLKGTVEVYY
ncbi:hypothetical protein Poli38472_011063 [Pythium oligandrum]|uniref:Beta-lactamase-related domain-containing protein n=1 Tax=Pythium oligandrum TaxID=41045 RepID=A0A8K1CR39_PYTOL|nr:hypothetical protein Poli38472_011063 [Pythium oligandrum]|eukprot:TMW67443.1 hypothetical protein Poli38472_011063 [Pythium oligandrum]